MRHQKGTALLEVIVIGFAVVLMVLPVIGTVARLAEAHSDVQMAARDGAIWVARHGGDPPEVDGVDVSVIKRSVVVEVVATREVDLVGVLGATVGRTVQATVRMPVSNYRSAP